jgi:methionyl-tRNA formyltransferase
MPTQSQLKIVFMGTPEFAVESLKAIVNAGYFVPAVVTVPDKPAGRGQRVSQSAVKSFAVEHEIEVLQPEKLKDQQFIDQLTRIEPDIFVVVAFRMLPEAVWRIPRLGTFNLHASLLPQYRGAAPINWSIINGETKTGLTTFLIDSSIDTGNIILSKEVSIDPNETAGELHDRMLVLGADLVLTTIELIASKNFKAISQESFVAQHDVLKPAPKLYKDICKVDWNKPALQVHNLIRGLSPYPGAWANLTNGNGDVISVKLMRSTILNRNRNSNTDKPGTLITNGKTFLHVHCGLGSISIDEMQLPGKRNLTIKDLLMGFRGIESYRFESF